MFRLCREHSRFVFELFPDVFGNEITAEEYVTWQAYDFMTICGRHNVDPRDFEDLKGVVDEILHRRTKDELRIKKITEGK